MDELDGNEPYDDANVDDNDADELDYVALPASVKDLIRKQWADNLKDASGKAISYK